MSIEGGHEPEEQSLERRAALRRGAAVLAGVAGLGVAAAATASSAEAAAGDPVVLGAANDAGITSTSVTSSTGASTLALADTGAGAPLQVVPNPNLPADTSAAGEQRSFDTGAGFALPVYTHITGTGPGAAAAVWGFVYSDVWAVQPIGVIPRRVLNTTSAAGRQWVLDPAGKFDSAGRLLAGRTITLSLSGYVFGPGAVLGNLTAVGSLAAGFLVIYPVDPRPGNSSVAYATGQTIGNFSFTAMHFDGTHFTVRIYTKSTTHVVFDFTGFAVGSADFINSAILPAAPAPTAVNPAAAPEWFRRQQAQRGAGLR